MNPFTDVAQMIARMLMQVHTIPLTLDDLKVAVGQWRKEQANLLKDTFELKPADIESLAVMLERSTTSTNSMWKVLWIGRW